MWTVFIPQTPKKTQTLPNNITFQEVYEKGLNVMDMTAVTLCHENKLTIIVFDMNRPGNLHDIVNGAEVGTLIN